MTNVYFHSAGNKKKGEKDYVPEQVFYMGRWVNKDFFRAFIYDVNGAQKICNTYDDFELALGTGIWFESIEAANKSIETPKNIKDLAGSDKKEDIQAAEELILGEKIQGSKNVRK
jgi:hypothetical protein